MHKDIKSLGRKQVRIKSNVIRCYPIQLASHIKPQLCRLCRTFVSPAIICSITGKHLNGFSWNFQRRLDIIQWSICNIFGVLRLTPWIPDRFFYFLESCLLRTSWKNGCHFQDMSGITQEKKLARLFYSSLNYFTVSYLSATACQLATLR